MPKMSKYYIYNKFPTVPILGFGILLSILAGKFPPSQIHTHTYTHSHMSTHIHIEDRKVKANKQTK